MTCTFWIVPLIFLCGMARSRRRTRKRRLLVCSRFYFICYYWNSNCILGRECAHLFFRNYDRPSWAKVWEISAGSEPPFFTEHFANWPEPIFTKFAARQDRGFYIQKSKAPVEAPKVRFLYTIVILLISWQKTWEWDYSVYFKTPRNFDPLPPAALKHHLILEVRFFINNPAILIFVYRRGLFRQLLPSSFVSRTPISSTSIGKTARLSLLLGSKERTKRMAPRKLLFSGGKEL